MKAVKEDSFPKIPSRRDRRPDATSPRRSNTVRSQAPQRRGITSIPTPWLATSQSGWERYIGDETIPNWFRLWIVAKARCNANLHAQFSPGELANLMGKSVDGDWKPMSSNQLSNVIKDCRERGLLHRRSGQRCLSLPEDQWESGLKEKYDPCSTCATEISKPRRKPHLRRVSDQP